MMRYRLRQKRLTLSDHYVVRDEVGEAVYRIDGQFWTALRKLHFRDMEGNALATILQPSAGQLLEIHRPDLPTVLIRWSKAGSVRTSQSAGEPPGTETLFAEGSVFTLDYTLRRGEREVGRVDRTSPPPLVPFSPDDYTVEIEDGEDEVAILAAAVAIDQSLTPE